MTENKAKPRDGVNEINKVCKAVLKLTEEDFKAADEMAKGQSDYNHPLKMATAGWQNELGNHNQRVLSALKNLQDVISGGADIKKPL